MVIANVTRPRTVRATPLVALVVLWMTALAVAPPPARADVALTGTPTGQTPATTATFTFVGADDGARCRLDGRRWERCASPVTYTGLAAGAHQFSVRTRDDESDDDDDESERPSRAVYRWRVVASGSVVVPPPRPAPAPVTPPPPATSPPVTQPPITQRPPAPTTPAPPVTAALTPANAGTTPAPPPTSQPPAPIGPTGSTPRPTSVAAPVLLTPFPVIRLAGTVRRGRVVVRLLTIRLPRGAFAEVRCYGRGCPFRVTRVRTPRRLRAPSATVAVRRLAGRSLRAGTRLEVRATRAGTIGKITTFRFATGRVPSRSDACLLPGQRRPVACPA